MPWFSMVGSVAVQWASVWGVGVGVLRGCRRVLGAFYWSDARSSDSAVVCGSEDWM